jgi:GTP-binding protein EngB required for normal cell division
MGQPPALLALGRCIERLMGIGGVPRVALEQWRDKLCAQRFNVVVMGQFKRGKSTVINALIGAELLPVGVVPLTSVVTVLAHGETVRIEVRFEDGRRETAAPERLRDFVTETGNPDNAKGVREVRIAHPSPWLKRGVRVVDTPGIGSVFRHNTDVAYGFLPEADAVVLVLSVDQPIGEAEYEFLRKIREHAAKVFVLLNKVDLLTAAELAESIDFTRRTVADAMGGGANLFPICARRALAGPREGTDEAFGDDGFSAFSRALETFLRQEKVPALVASVGRRLARALAEARARTEIELASLNTPLEELQRKIRAFDARKADILQSRNDSLLLIESETRGLVERTVNADREAFAADLTRRLDAEVERGYRERRRVLSARALHEALRAHVVTGIRQAYDARVQQKEQTIAGAFEALCARFAGRVNQMVDELLAFSSDLFGVRFQPVRADSAWQMDSTFSYKFGGEPIGLEIATASLMLALPKPISGPWLLQQTRRFLRESVDRQSGRLRHELSQRLERSVEAFSAALLEQTDATVAAIEQAVKTGGERKAAGTQQAAETSRDLSVRLDALNAVDEELTAVRHDVGVVKNRG